MLSTDACLGMWALDCGWWPDSITRFPGAVLVVCCIVFIWSKCARRTQSDKLVSKYLEIHIVSMLAGFSSIDAFPSFVAKVIK
jgi:hypothetical protein